MSNLLTIVMYHYVRPIVGGPYPGLRGLEPEQFAAQLDYIGRHYRPVTMADVIAALQGEGELPERAIHLQFDDGYTDHLDWVAPELDKRGIKGAFFPIASAALDRRVIVVNKIQFVLACAPDMDALVADMEQAILERRAHRPHIRELADYRRQHFVATRLDTAEVIYVKRVFQRGLPADVSEEIAGLLFRKYVSADERAFAETLYMSLDQLGSLIDAGHHIGCHTERHPWLGSLPRAEQQAEIASALRLHDRLGLPRNGFTICYPYGDYNTDTLAVMHEFGCAAGFTAEVALADLERSNPLALPRLDAIDLPMHAGAEPNDWTRQASPLPTH